MLCCIIICTRFEYGRLKTFLCLPGLPDLFHIVKNRPFIDGNERSGAVCTLVFLALNSYDFTAPQQKFTDFVLPVIKGELSKADAAVFVQKWAKKLQRSNTVHFAGTISSSAGTKETSFLFQCPDL